MQRSNPTPSTNIQTQTDRLSDENARLRRENQQLSRTLAQLQSVARTIVDEPDKRELTLRLAEQIAEWLKAERVMVGTLLNGAIIVEQAVQQGRLEPVDLSFQPGEGLTGWVMKHKRSYLGAEAEGNDPRNLALAVPILNHQDHLLGVIECHKAASNLPFSQKDMEFLQVIALQVAPGLERAHLFEQMQRWITSMESLLAFSASLNKQLEPEVLIKRLVEYAAGFLGAEAGLAGLVTAEAIVSDGYWQQGRWQDFKADWPPHEEVCTPGWVLINQCPYLTNDYPNDNLANPDLINTFGVKNALCVPIMDARETVLGFVELHNKDGGREPFTWSDAHFMESLASSTAIVLHNARLLHELQIQRGQLQALSAQNLTILEDERRRIARELHDEAGQALVGIKLGLQLLARKIPDSSSNLRQAVDELRSQINESTAQLKEIAHTLRPPILDELGLVVALNKYINDLQARTTIPIHFEALNLATRLPQSVETACYRLVQEALTNVLRHAEAAQAWITLSTDEEQLFLSIRDDGQGFDVAEQSQTGLGLLGMRERVMIVGGVFALKSTPGAGTTIDITIPLKQKDEL